MDAHPDRPSELPCGCCGASVPISWASLDADSWRGVGRCSGCGRYVESYQSDIGFPWAFVSYVLGAGAVPRGRAGAGAGRELATASRQAPVFGTASLTSSYITRRDP